ncbi:DUF362 domain-containing protein [Desulfovibrio inopinatus]|uniref:DUF362 domain-containing protein n=1 Tax=Desulfovibrio inopinatus TaxID=102109 RepID=UPI00041DBE56|nr:DUF362 domain-containing protein [Desulfovibrio inopinatus]
MPIAVSLCSVVHYTEHHLDDTIARLLEHSAGFPTPGTRVLVKPNLVGPYNTGLSCTHPAIVRSVCRILLDCGARIEVGDSPAFGSAKVIARLCGLSKALADLPVKLVNFSSGEKRPLTLGGHVTIAKPALETDVVVNVPKVKAHTQMFLTLAVKNLFGCVVGFRKALAHQTLGDEDNRFESMLVDVMLALPRTVNLIDGIQAMHVTGPAKGVAYSLGLLAASADAVAMDTALYKILGAHPNHVPIWQECRARGFAGAIPDDLVYPMSSPVDFDASGFRLPEKTTPVAFAPARFLIGRIKSLYFKWR